jgi:Rrf2 family protein
VLKLTKKADYGLIALKHLAMNAGHRAASAKEIAECYQIPLPLLAKVLQKLNKSGLLRSEQGTNGGYRLARDAREISTLDAIRTIDGPIILTHCFTDHGGCNQSGTCTVREPLRKVHEGILNLLGGISIWDLARDETPAQGSKKSSTEACGPTAPPAHDKLYELTGKTV